MPDIIAIDGPAGAGKSTVARHVAAALGYTYLDTGAMYRAVAWSAIQRRIVPTDGIGLTALAESLHIEFGPLTDDCRQTILVNGVDATNSIRTAEVSNLTSAISALSTVRTVVVAQQREIAARALHGVVLEGRDIGTVVFPNAQLKVFLTAKAEERARRRYEELVTQGSDTDFDQVYKDQLERDSRDSSRAASPLTPAADALTIMSDGLTIDEVVSTILQLHSSRRPCQFRDNRDGLLPNG